MGFAMGNGRRKGGGVRGTTGTNFCMGAGVGSMIVGMGFGRGSRGGDGGDGELSVGFGLLSGM